MNLPKPSIYQLKKKEDVCNRHQNIRLKDPTPKDKTINIFQHPQIEVRIQIPEPLKKKSTQK